jgi:hypothetical protein
VNIAEYIDGGHPHHNQCYPNPPGSLCHDPDRHIYNSSQGIIKQGAPFKAGIYKPVDNVVPCTLYTFEIWNRNDAAGSIYHPRLGMDPTGWIITRLGNSPPDNCPPTGTSRCPDPYIGGAYGFPSTMVWSDELTQPAYTWGKGSLTVEAVNTTISVWTYTEPDSSQVSMSTYWDYGSVVQTPFPGNKLPDPQSWIPSDFIQGVTSQVIENDLVIEWNTLEPASTQISYTITHAVNPPPAGLTNTTFLPLMYVPEIPKPSTLDTTPVVHHIVTLEQLFPGDSVAFIPMSRRALNNTCVTEVGSLHEVTIE